MKGVLIINFLLLLSADLELCQEDFDTTITVESTVTVKTQKLRQKIVEGPTNVSVVLGESVRLKCKVAEQAGSVVWTKRGFFLGLDRGLATHPRYSMVGSSTKGEYDLQIQNVQLSDEDVYQCQILAAGREQPLQISDEVKLTVLVPSTNPRFVDLDDEGETLQGREGYPLTARCISQGGKPEASLEFYVSTDRTGENLVRHLVQDTPYEIMTHNELNDIESSIKFTPESYDDGKFLICAARHPAVQKVMITSARLKIRNGPYFKSIAEKFIVSKGQTITFSCTVDSNPAPTTYKWTKSAGVGRFSTTFGQNLSLDNIQPGHEGSYTCEVAVEGFPPVRQTHQLFVKGPPKVVIENVPDAVEGGSAKIACKITGRPKSHDNVTWFKGRAMISTQMGHRFEISTSRINDEELYSVLLIRKVLTIDFDAYNCTASNSMGLFWASTRLIESTNFPVHFMMPGVVGGVLAILVIALAIVWANKKYICRSKSSTASDVQVALDDLTPKYNTDTYSTGPMVDSMEGIGGKSNYMRIPQENPDLDEQFYTQHLMPFLANGTLGRQLGSPVYPRSVHSLTPPPPHAAQLLNDLSSLNGGLNANYLYNDQQQPYVHQTLGGRVYDGNGRQQVPHFSIQQAKNYAHSASAANNNNNNGAYSTFGRYPQHQTTGLVAGSADNSANCQTGLYRYSPQQQQFLNGQGGPSLYGTPANYPAHLQSNLTLLETVPELATPEMMDEANLASMYDNGSVNGSGGLSRQRTANGRSAYPSLEVIVGEDGRPIHRCASQLSTHV